MPLCFRCCLLAFPRTAARATLCPVQGSLCRILLSSLHPSLLLVLPRVCSARCAVPLFLPRSGWRVLRAPPSSRLAAVSGCVVVCAERRSLCWPRFSPLSGVICRSPQSDATTTVPLALASAACRQPAPLPTDTDDGPRSASPLPAFPRPRCRLVRCTPVAGLGSSRPPGLHSAAQRCQYSRSRIFMLTAGNGTYCSMRLAPFTQTHKFRTGSYRALESPSQHRVLSPMIPS